MEEKERLFKNIESTMNTEGLFIEEENKNIIFKYLNNEITEDMGIEYIKAKYK